MTNDPISLAVRNAGKLTLQEIQGVIQPLEAAFTAMREGVASEWQWSLAASAVNSAQAIEKRGIVRGLKEHFRAAEMSLQGIYRRAMDTGVWKPTALYYLELDAIRTAIELHKFQLEQLSRGEVIAAVRYAEAEVRSTGGRVLPYTQQMLIATTDQEAA